MQHYVASHLGLRSLTMSHLWDARLKWVTYPKPDAVFTLWDLQSLLMPFFLSFHSWTIENLCYSLQIIAFLFTFLCIIQALLFKLGIQMINDLDDKI